MNDPVGLTGHCSAVVLAFTGQAVTRSVSTLKKLIDRDPLSVLAVDPKNQERTGRESEASPAVRRQSLVAGDDQGVDEHLPFIQLTELLGRCANFLDPAIRKPRLLDRDTPILNA